MSVILNPPCRDWEQEGREQERVWPIGFVKGMPGTQRGVGWGVGTGQRELSFSQEEAGGNGV